MKLEHINNYAIKLIELLKPYCKRIEIAGSIRREKPDCKDIEIVCIPDAYKLEEFFIYDRMINRKKFMKNGAKYKQFKYDGVNVDLFICNKDNWGWIYLIRTGSRDFNIRVVNALANKGIVSTKGYLYKIEGTFLQDYLIGDPKLYDTDLKTFGNHIVTGEEQDIFDLLECNFIEPTRRNIENKK